MTNFFQTPIGTEPNQVPLNLHLGESAYLPRQVYVGAGTINFGSFPGGYDASLVITGQPAIAASSVVRAALIPQATADRSADEHWLETISILAGNIVAGIGFTIYAVNSSQLAENPIVYPRGFPIGRSPLIWGTWNVGWQYS